LKRLLSQYPTSIELEGIQEISSKKILISKLLRLKQKLVRMDNEDFKLATALDIS
jgi:hypothetical protein